MLLTAVPQVLTVCAGHWNKVSFNISIRKYKTNTRDEHKHCTMQPSDSAFGGHREGQTFERGGVSLASS